MEANKLDTVRLKDGTEYPLGCSWENLTGKPFHGERTDLFSDAVLTFAYTSNYEGFIYQSMDAEILGKWDTQWSHACVTVDGVRYHCKKQVLNGFKHIGDGLRILTGASASGEPFAMGVMEGAFLLLMFADSGQEEGATEAHTVSVTLEYNVIRSEYLPGIPEFDLTAMGLPNIPIGGDQVSVACDTADLRAAMDNGLVKLTFQATNGVFTSVASYIATAIHMEGEYQVSLVGTMGTPMLFNIIVTSSGIAAKIMTLAIPETTDMTIELSE